MSPKFLAGESYGTLRAAALAEHLQTRYGMYLNGLMLISMVLDMGTIRFTEGNDGPYALFLPTYAAIAHHHGLHGDRRARRRARRGRGVRLARLPVGAGPWAPADPVRARGGRCQDCWADGPVA